MSRRKPHATVAFIGHVDSGKSTTIGHLLLQSGLIDGNSLHSAMEEARTRGVQSYKFAYITDKLQSERKRRVTIEAATRRLETEKYTWTVIDTPGHRDFIGSTISAVSEADFAVLVIAASVGEFEAGISRWGQTREHPLLAFTLGIKRLICCVNKMDEASVNWSERRFREIEKETGDYLTRIGFSASDIVFIPISGWRGENLVRSPLSLPWYTGPSLTQLLDACSLPHRSTAQSLRFPIRKVYRIAGVGTVLAGRVATGRLCVGQTVRVCPSDCEVTVTSMEMQHVPVQEATAGDVVGIRVEGDCAKIRPGEVVSDREDPAMECESFTAQIIVVNHPGRIRNGYTPVVDCHSAHFSCRFDQILAKIDRRTAKVLEENPEFLRNGDAAIIRFLPQRCVCVESFVLYPCLGRFIIRDQTQCVGVGVITETVRRERGGVGLKRRMGIV